MTEQQQLHIKLLINCFDINHNINDKSLNRVTCRLSLANPESNQNITCEL